MNDYPKIDNNKWVYPIQEGYLFKCCDCGLIHSMDFGYHDGVVRFRVRRNDNQRMIDIVESLRNKDEERV